MALLGTAAQSSSSVGPWLEVTLSAAAAITANAETAHTVTLPANVLNPNLPILGCVLLSGTVAIQGGTNNCGVGIGFRTITVSGTTLTVTFAADAAAAANIPSGSRLIFLQAQGV